MSTRRGGLTGSWDAGRFEIVSLNCEGHSQDKQMP